MNGEKVLRLRRFYAIIRIGVIIVDNLEYIKSLEERIEKLEKLVSAIELKDKSNISFTNCNIQAIGMQSCKNTSISCVNAENFALAAFSVKIDSSNIEKFENKSTKTKIYNSDLSNSKE